MDSTEHLTKFLRNKATPVADIYATVQKLFRNSSSLYLPNAEKFVLELLCDRLSQNNQLGYAFKADPLFWEMFKFVWDVCSTSAALTAMRARVLTNLKFGEILSQLVADINDRELFEQEQYVECVFTVVGLLIDNGRVSFSQDQNFAFVKTVLASIVENNYSNDTTFMLCAIVHKVFKLANSNVAKYDTKHVKEFATFVLPHLLIVINRKLEFDQSMQSEMQQLVTLTLFRTDTLPNVLENIEFFLNSPSASELESAEYIYLLRQIIPQVKITELEAIYKMIIESNASHSGPLLREITSMNKTLSTVFLSSLVERELKATAVNVEVISSAITRNSEVGLKYQDQIMALCLSQNDIALLKVLFECFMNARESDSFVDLWSKSTSSNETSVLTSDEFIDYTSSRLVSLSNVQLTAIVAKFSKEYAENCDCYPVVLISVAKGLLRGVAGTVANALSKTLIKNLSDMKSLLVQLLTIKGKYCFKLSFYILCLFDLELVKEEVDLGELFLDSKSVKDEYYYYSYFRIVEQDIDLFSKSKAADFCKFYLSTSNDAFKIRIFNRWLVLIDVLLEQNQVDELISKLFKSKTLSEEQIMDILRHPLLSDQAKITSAVISFVKANPKKIYLLKELSVYVYSKKQRIDMLDLLLANVLAGEMGVDDFSVIASKLLQLPTFRSTVETSIDSLVKLVKLPNSNVLMTMIGRIFESHVSQNNASSEFIVKSFKKIEKGLKKSPFVHIPLAMLLAQAAGESFSEQRDSLIGATFNKCISLLKEGPESNEKTTSLLGYIAQITQLTTVKDDDLTAIIDKLSQNTSRDIQNSLFALISKAKLYDPTHTLALYVVLSDIANFESLSQFIKATRSDYSAYSSIWTNALQSITQDVPGTEASYFAILSALLQNAEKPDDSEMVAKYHQLATSSISQILTSLTKTTDFDVDVVFHVLEALKTIATSKGWLLSQYSSELCLTFITNVARLYKFSNLVAPEKYIQLAQTMSAFILYQRYRFTNRHHLVVYTFVALLNLLISRSAQLNVECGLSFERLMSNLCEPNSNFIVSSSSSEVSKDVALSKALAQLKANLRKNLHVLLFNYIKFYLQYQMDLDIKAHLDTSVFMILDLFTTAELHYINKSLDNQGRVVFKKLYDDYQKFYRWKEE